MNLYANWILWFSIYIIYFKFFFYSKNSNDKRKKKGSNKNKKNCSYNHYLSYIFLVFLNIFSNWIIFIQIDINLQNCKNVIFHLYIYMKKSHRFIVKKWKRKKKIYKNSQKLSDRIGGHVSFRETCQLSYCYQSNLHNVCNFVTLFSKRILLEECWE